MARENLSTEALTERWEDQREIKNLMGIYANYITLNMDGRIFSDLWSSEREDVCYGTNDGWYIGRGDVAGYYTAIRKRNELVARCLQKKFPQEIGGKRPEEIFGIGTFRVFPMSCPVIEIAGDRQTAKGLWYCQGSHAEVEGCGPISRWTWGYYAADFVRENGCWKLWHLQHTNDVDAVCGKSWGKPSEALPLLPEFQELEDFQMPAPTRSECLRMAYAPDRPLAAAPPMPEPYAAFAETFSYGA